MNSLEEQKAFVEEGLRKAQGNSKRSTLDAKMERWQQERSRAKEQLEQSQVAEGDTKGAHAEATVRSSTVELKTVDELLHRRHHRGSYSSMTRACCISHLWHGD